MTVSLNLESQLVAVLKSLCPRVFPDVAPSGTAAPYVVWHLYGGQAPSYVEGKLFNRRNGYVQINVWGPVRTECNTLSLQIEQALVEQSSLQATALNALSSTYDENTDLRASMQDFSLWADR